MFSSLEGCYVEWEGFIRLHELQSCLLVLGPDSGVHESLLKSANPAFRMHESVYGPQTTTTTSTSTSTSTTTTTTAATTTTTPTSNLISTPTPLPFLLLLVLLLLLLPILLVLVASSFELLLLLLLVLLPHEHDYSRRTCKRRPNAPPYNTITMGMQQQSLKSEATSFRSRAKMLHECSAVAVPLSSA